MSVSAAFNKNTESKHFVTRVEMSLAKDGMQFRAMQRRSLDLKNDVRTALKPCTPFSG
jgi:hypothetical protein